MFHVMLKKEASKIEKKAVKSNEKYYEMILDWFRQQLILGELKEGDIIPSERELATKFGVSRVPVREALRILEYIGIISNGPDGMEIQRVDIQILNPKVNFASMVTMETITNLFEVRIFMESAAAYYAALRHTKEDIQRMRASIQLMSDVIEDSDADEASITKTSHDFHLCVIAAAKNPVLENMYKNLYDLLEVSKHYTMVRTHVSDSTLMDHEAILYKIESGNAEEASKYMKFHLNRALKKLTAESSQTNVGIGEYGSVE